MTTRQIKKQLAEATTIAEVKHIWGQYAEEYWQAGSTLPRSPYLSICEAHWDALYKLGYEFDAVERACIASHASHYTAPWNR